MISFSIIIPTLGRASLKVLLDQLVPQLAEDDEIIVLEDGTEKARELVEGLGQVYIPLPKFGVWGSMSVNIGMTLASKSHLLFIGDDDQSLLEHLSTIREFADPELPTMFQMQHENGYIWGPKVVQCGNVGLQMLCVPNNPEKLGFMTERYEGDFDLIEQIYAAYDRQMVWVEKAVVVHGISKKKDNGELAE